jgi:molybdopterin molybdotransferase
MCAVVCRKPLMPELLNVDTAIARILDDIHTLPSEMIAIEDALGRVLAEDARAETSIPPFANSSMDGYAVRAADTASGNARLRAVLDIPAGAIPPEQVIQPGEAARIMTGAPMPPGADAVVPMEQTDQGWNAGEPPPLPDLVGILTSAKAGDNVRPIGEDVQAGQTVLKAGRVLRAAELGVLAALGYARVSVIRQPRVAIVSTGDELLEADQPLTPGKIRDVNSYTIAGLVTTYGGIPIRIPIARDTLEDVRRRFNEALSHQPDLILSSAGVSVGTFDVVRTVLNELGAVNFWRVNLRPGKPLAYGHLSGVPFFGLPGNPVSAMVTFDVFVRPVLQKLTQKPEPLPTVQAVVSEEMRSDGRRSYIRVILRRENGQLVATTTGTQSSGALTSMVLADGLLIIPEGVTQVAAGQKLDVRLLRWID